MPQRRRLEVETLEEPQETGPKPVLEKVPQGLTEENWKNAYDKIVIFAYRRWPNERIAKRLSMAVATIARIRKSPIFVAKSTAYKNEVLARAADREAERTVTDKARLILEKKALQAARTIAKLMKEGTSKDRLRFDVCKEILHLNGIKPVEVVETRDRAYTPEEIASAAETIRQMLEMKNRLSKPEDAYLLKQDTDTPEETLLEPYYREETDAESPLTDESSSQTGPNRQGACPT